MANICITSYTFTGDKDDLRSLYNFMNSLKEDNSFSTLLEALGSGPERVNCRGEWYDLAISDATVTFTTATAWTPLYQAIELLCRHFRALRYFYYAEEPGCDIFMTNDVKGFYYPRRITDGGRQIELANVLNTLIPYPNDDGTHRLVAFDGTVVGTMTLSLQNDHKG